MDRNVLAILMAAALILIVYGFGYFINGKWKKEMDDRINTEPKELLDEIKEYWPQLVQKYGFNPNSYETIRPVEFIYIADIHKRLKELEKK